jgi:hypothetical protein
MNRRMRRPDLALLRRARQWLAARNRLVARWIARFTGPTRTSAPSRKLGRVGSIVLPFWWEYESELKCRLALETLLRKLFSLVPRLNHA